VKHTEAKTETFQRVVKVTCDICGADTDSAGYRMVDEVEIVRRAGTADPDGGGLTKTWEPDVCGKCFDSKVRPAIEAMLAAPVADEAVEH
jgi:hypothetical protein